MICIELDNACGTTCQMMIYDAMTARGVVDESIFVSGVGILHHDIVVAFTGS